MENDGQKRGIGSGQFSGMWRERERERGKYSVGGGGGGSNRSRPLTSFNALPLGPAGSHPVSKHAATQHSSMCSIVVRCGAAVALPQPAGRMPRRRCRFTLSSVHRTPSRRCWLWAIQFCCTARALRESSRAARVGKSAVVRVSEWANIGEWTEPPQFSPPSVWLALGPPRLAQPPLWKGANRFLR